MRTHTPAAALLALTLTAALPPTLLSRAAAQNDPAASQARGAYTLDATVSQVDADRDRVIVTGDDGRTYTIDTYQSKIVLRGSDHAGQTGDLVPGMRLHIAGSRLSPDLVEADRVSVLPYREARPAPPARRPDAPAAVAASPRVTLRGTVQSVDDPHGAFVVQVNDHTRRVFVGDRTELRDLPDDGNSLPVHAGDRVTVVGALQSDGTVQATLVTPRRLDELAPDSHTAPVPDAPSAAIRPAPSDGGSDLAEGGHTLTGRVSKESDYFSRDIKIRLSVDREITVRVPKNIPILRDGRAVSIHDLKDDQPVRVSGDYENDDFKATRIEFLDGPVGDRLDF